MPFGICLSMVLEYDSHTPVYSTTHVLQCSVWEESLNTPLLSRPSGLELGRDVVISGARVIQLIGAILLARAVSLVIGLVGDMGGGGRQHAPVVNLKDRPWSRSSDWTREQTKGHLIVIWDPDLKFP